jgi:PII-like signaling protein
VNIPQEAILLRLFLNANDRLHGKAIYRLVVETARANHLAGASVFLVDFSYGAHKKIRDAKSDYLSFDIPVVVEVVDSGENIGKLQTELDSLITEGLVVTRPVQVRHYAGQSIPGTAKKTTAPEKAPSTTFASGSSSTMKIEGEAQRLTVYIGNSDTWRGRNLVTAIVEKCRELGLAGATATVGVMGFGKTSRIHRAHLLGLSEDLPERIEIVDQPERIEVLLPALEELVQGGLIVLEDVRVTRYLHDPRGAKS